MKPFWPLLLAGAVAGSSVAAIAQPHRCPLEGDARQPLARELNPFKNRDDAPAVSRILPTATLTAVLAPGNDLDRWSRDDGAILEGVVVGVKVGGIESVNCHARDPAHRDTHIELALKAGAPENERVIVEVTPRWREKMAVIADWSTPALKKRLLGQRVRITGWLFDDLEHEAQAENTNPGAARNWRASVWEVHPVTGIQLLSRSSASSALAPGKSRTDSHPRRSSKQCSHSGAHRCAARAHKSRPPEA